MKHLLLTLSVCAGIMTANAQGVYQIPNSDFEGNWNTNTRGKYTETTPENWNSFYTAQGSATTLAFMVANQIGTLSKSTDSHSGNGAALITATKNLLGSISNGNLTTGIVNMGSATANDPENYNFSDMSSNTGCCQFAGLPDAVRFWVKFNSQDASKGNASANMILHTDAGYMDPSTKMGDENEKASRIAKAYQEINPDNTWKEYIVPFQYNDNDLYLSYTGQKYLLASFSTNKAPGIGTGGDALAIDDIQMLYYSELASLKYNEVEYFKEEETHFNIPEYYNEDNLSYSSNGRGAQITSSYDEGTAVLTLTVEGNNISEDPTNVHTYTIQFKSESASITPYTNSLMVFVGGAPSAPIEKTINLINETDGSISLAIYDFNFNGIPVGDIIINNLHIEQNGDQTIYTGQQTITVMNMPAQVNVTATVENNEMTAMIPIEVVNGLMKVDVIFAPALNIDGQSTVATEHTGLHNVTLARTFAAGWNTICLPFATTTSAFGQDVKAQAFTDIKDGEPAFKEVTDMEANKPYLIYFPETTNKPFYFGTEINSILPEAVTYGDFTFCGAYEAHTDMNGKYGFVDTGDTKKIVLGHDNTSLEATQAYFIKEGDQPEEINLILEGGTTDIQTITNCTKPFDIYNLQGIMIRHNTHSIHNLPKGIYIINGKKIAVK